VPEQEFNTARPVLILGAGINGCALARELLLNQVNVCLVDQADVASGATAYSSRLIHGGLRYLEYGEFDLVRESLAERTRLLRLAPHLVKPIRLAIPSRSRFSGLAAAALRFAGWRWWPLGSAHSERGLMLVRLGLNLYDAYARDPLLPRHSVESAANSSLPIDKRKFRWLANYYDAQIPYPERLVLAMLKDGSRQSLEGGPKLTVLTYHQAHLSGDEVSLTPTGSTNAGERFKPLAIVNATGAWVDDSLKRLHVSSERLIGGTKGSHFVTFHGGLRRALDGQGIYAEATDGRPIFILPLGHATLVGTTDLPWEEPPEAARATSDEIDYLLTAVQSVLPVLGLTRGDVDFHYSGVRPLPYVAAAQTAAITRRHFVVKHDQAALPVYSIVGGKLTTCRSLAEQAAARILPDLGRKVIASSAGRLFPGAEGYPGSEAEVPATLAQLAAAHRLELETVATIWRLHGTSTHEILRDIASEPRSMVPGTALLTSFVEWTIRNEWVSTLSDLVERRLMLLYDQRLTRPGLQRLAELLVAVQSDSASDVTSIVERTIERLSQGYGKRVE